MNLSYAVKAIAAKVEAEHGMTKLAQLLRPNPAQEAAILRSLQEQCTAAERARLLTQTKRHAIIHDGKLWTLNCPVVATNSAGMAIVLGSITDEIGKVDHVAIPASEFFDGGVIVLAKNKDVDDNNLPTIDAVPEEMQPPPVADGAAAANAPTNGVARLHLHWEVVHDTDDTPVFTSMPIVFPLPNSMAIPPNGHPINTPVPGATASFEMWRQSMGHLIAHNEGKSLHAGGPLFDPAALTTAVNDAHDETPVAVTLVDECSFEMHALSQLNPGEEAHINAVDAVCEAEHTAIVFAFANAANMIPTGQGHPVPPPPPMNSGGEENLAAALKEAVKSTKQKDREDTAATTEAKLRLKFARIEVVDGVNTLVLPNLTPFGKAFLVAEQAKAEEMFQNSVTSGRSQLKGSGHLVDSLVTFTANQVTPAFAAAWQKGKFPTEHFNVDPALLRTTVNCMCYLRQKGESVSFKEMVRYNEQVRSQELVDEDPSKRSHRKSEQHIGGDISGFAMCHVAANMLFIGERLVQDVRLSEWWKAIEPYFHTLNDAKAWRLDTVNDQVPSVILLGDFHGIDMLFNLSCCDFSLIEAVKNNQPIDWTIHSRAKAFAQGTVGKLSRAVMCGEHTQEYSTMPTFGRSLPQFKPPKQASEVKFTLPPNAKKSSTRQQSGSPTGNGSPAGNTNPSNPPNNGNTDSGSNPAAEKGWLQFTGARHPNCGVRIQTTKNGTTSNERMCMFFVCRGLACNRGASCGNAHPTSFSKLSDTEKQKVSDWVNRTNSISFVPGQGPATTGTP